MSSRFQYQLQKVRETKGAVLYNEVDSAGKVLDAYSGKVGNQYIRKSAFTGAVPNQVRVTVEYD